MPDTVVTGDVQDGYRFSGGDPKDKQNWHKLPQVGEVENGFQFKGGDPSKKENWQKVSAWPGGLEGSVKAQAAGWLHSISEAVGSPIDIVAAGLRKAGVPVGQEPVLGSRNVRRLMDVPGQVAGWLANEVAGEGTAARWGLEGHATYEDINEVPSVYRPQARAGEVLGATASMLAPISAVSGMAAPAERLAAAATPAESLIKQLGRQQLAEAAKPGFATRAIPSAIGAAAGAYGAETAFPGSETAQLVGQLAGGLAPTGVLTGAERGVSTAKKPLDAVIVSTPEGAKTVIARSLGKEFAKAGETPEASLHRLRGKPVIPGASPAEMSGSPVLLGVEKKLAETNPELANRLAIRNAAFLQNIHAAINQAFIPGERQALTRAAQGVKDQLDKYVANAEAAAQESATKLAPTESRESANLQARQILESALSNARKAENELWELVPKKSPITATKTIEAFKDVKREMLPEAKLSALVERVFSRLKKAPETTLGDLQNLRSEILNEARIARGASDFNLARRLENISSGIIEDTSEIGGDDAKLARSFSRELNDRFSRSIAGDILGLRETGAPAVRPALTLETVVTGKPQAIALKLAELQKAATAIPKQVDEAGNIIKPSMLSPEMREVQEQFLRSLSSRFTNVETGRIEPTKAASFLRDYQPVLAQFPLYRQQIENAITSQLASDRISGVLQDVDREAFARVLSAGEVPMRAIAKVLASPTPVKDFANLARMAKNAGLEAVAGLRASILDFVMDGSLIRGNVSYDQAKKKILASLYPNGPSLLRIMESNGIIDSKQAGIITARLNAAAQHEVAAQQALRIDEVGDEAGKIARWTARIIGAKLSSKLGFTHGGAGPSLQVAQIAASAAEQALTKLPLDKARRALTDALASDKPDQLIDILERISGEGEGGIKQPTNIRYMIPLLRTLYPHTKTQTRQVTPQEMINFP